MTRPDEGPKLPSHVVRSLRGLDRERIRAWARRSGQRLVDVDLQGCTDKASVLRALAQAFALPAWFGMNLDALYDALTDLRERDPADGYVVLIEGLPRSASFDSEQRAALLDVFRDVADDYADAKIPFRVLYG
jgi:RNAse (barnase) inhibitor barstar